MAMHHRCHRRSSHPGANPRPSPRLRSSQSARQNNRYHFHWSRGVSAMNAANRFARQAIAFLLTGCLSSVALFSQGTPQSKKPLDYANGLVGTAPLDKQKLIGNAPPPGEQLYSGFTSPGAELPHSSTDMAPINNNLDLAYPAGVGAPYYYPNRTMVGFSSGSYDGPTVMPVVGDWTVPPERSCSVYDKAREKSSPGYYSVYLDDFKTKVEMTRNHVDWNLSVHISQDGSSPRPARPGTHRRRHRSRRRSYGTRRGSGFCKTAAGRRC